ncbi:MAG: acetyl-CoA carboxylase carboxyl transferase subunit beta [Pelagibacteraceae bacterium]|nr:acetyl-CoA carboxylase carboxyl transferase subunit beta [Pelagibacteraceae bacterium]PPR52157.1 MAG: Acetyl-coenzyme A carboxylase carboxyl transferase subunit beta [Alphaproteobacteria bacterium MarineAlpha5_Bin10]|tara:strand:- start:4570 stop:5421 length:852 start_codon:yes stop_codon:yes gene_type:complete
MNWLTDFVKPKIKALVGRKDVPENLWTTCPTCANMIHHKDMLQNLNVCNNCNHHFKLNPETRLEIIFKKENYDFIEIKSPSDDPLKFKDKIKYSDRLKTYRKKTNFNDAYILASGNLDNEKILVGILNFDFMGGSMGRAVGSGIVQSVEKSIKEKIPLVIFSASGGARMQEGIVSLMQMPRTVAAIEKLSKYKIPYIVVLTDPTTGGVTASFAMLGDVTIAESGSTIGFAGKKVIQDTIREELPKDFQKAEYLEKHGMVDMVVDRKELKNTLSSIIKHLKNNQ